MSEQTARTPVIAKIFAFIAAVLGMVLALLVLVPLFLSTSNYYLPFFSRAVNTGRFPVTTAAILGSLLLFVMAAGILLYALGSAIGRKAGSSLCGVGLLIVAFLYFVKLLTNNVSVRFLSLYILLAVCCVLAALYFMLKGSGINWIVKLIASIAAIAAALFILVTSLISSIRASVPGFVYLRQILDCSVSVFLWVSVLLNTPFKKNA